MHSNEKVSEECTIKMPAQLKCKFDYFTHRAAEAVVGTTKLTCQIVQKSSIRMCKVCESSSDKNVLRLRACVMYLRLASTKLYMCE